MAATSASGRDARKLLATPEGRIYMQLAETLEEQVGSGAAARLTDPDAARRVREQIRLYTSAAFARIKHRLPRLHPAQLAIRAEARRFNVLACGRRFGKSLLGVRLLCEEACLGHPVAWFAPDYKYLSEAWRDMKTVLGPVLVNSNETEHRIEILGGGTVECWTLKNENAGRSRKYKRIVIDEAALVPDLDHAWNGSVRPTLIDLRGDAWFLSTPKGMNFFWRAWCKGNDPDQPQWASWQMPTSSNPHMPAEEVEALAAQMPERFRQQELEALFLEDAGGVFRGVRECVDAGRSGNEPPKPGARYSAGVDLARLEDFTVLTVIDEAGRQVYHERFNQVSWERVYESVRRVSTLYNRAKVWLDSTGVGDPPLEAIRRMGVPVEGYHFTGPSKERLIDALAMAIEGQQVRLMDNAQQTSELQAFQYELTPSRHVRMSAPEGMHDDCVMALALAWWPFSVSGRRGAKYVFV